MRFSDAEIPIVSCKLSNAITNMLGIKQAKSTILDVISALY